MDQVLLKSLTMGANSKVAKTQQNSKNNSMLQVEKQLETKDAVKSLGKTDLN